MPILRVTGVGMPSTFLCDCEPVSQTSLIPSATSDAMRYPFALAFDLRPSTFGGADAGWSVLGSPITNPLLSKRAEVRLPA